MLPESSSSLANLNERHLENYKLKRDLINDKSVAKQFENASVKELIREMLNQN